MDIQQLQKQIDDLSRELELLKDLYDNHSHNGLDTSLIDLDSVAGSFQTITDSSGATTNLDIKLGAPPQSVSDQIFYWTDTSLKRLYYYDSNNTSSTFSNGWHYTSMT